MTEPYLKKEDYEEPACPLCEDPFTDRPKQIPIGRVLEKLDEIVASRDADRALRHLDYWIAEAREGRDEGGELTLLNEKMGVLRKAERFEEALKTAGDALALVEKMRLDDAAAGTTFLNAATVKNAAGKPEEALPLYRSAAALYEKNLPGNDPRTAGLYNNEAVALTRTGRFEEAEKSYFSALAVLDKNENTCLDRAITYTNLANLYEEQKGPEEGEKEISSCLAKAKELLDDARVKQDAYAAFVYDKCAQVFDYFGWFAYAQELSERSKKLYEGT